jgi:replication factor A2
MNYDMDAGGFMPQSTLPAGNNPVGSPGPKKGERAGMLPLSCAMLKKAQMHGTEESFFFEGMQLSQITLIGRIEHVESQATNCTYRISDGSGTADVKLWITNDDAGYMDSKRHEWIEGAYVRVYGHIRVWQKQLSVVAFRMYTLQDWNELTFHLLEIMHTWNTHQKHAAVAGPGNLGAAPIMSGGVNMSLYGGGGMQAGGARNATQVVLQTIDRFCGMGGPHAMSGPSRQEIIQALAGSFGANEVNQAINALLEDGQVYSTSDDDHFKSISSNH